MRFRLQLDDGVARTRDTCDWALGRVHLPFQCEYCAAPVQWRAEAPPLVVDADELLPRSMHDASSPPSPTCAPRACSTPTSPRVSRSSRSARTPPTLVCASCTTSPRRRRRTRTPLRPCSPTPPLRRLRQWQRIWQHCQDTSNALAQPLVRFNLLAGMPLTHRESEHARCHGLVQRFRVRVPTEREHAIDEEFVGGSLR
jgi:hypothetical protein